MHTVPERRERSDQSRGVVPTVDRHTNNFPPGSVVLPFKDITMKSILLCLVLWAAVLVAHAQYSDGLVIPISNNHGNAKGWFSLGGRSTISAFSHDGAGLGTGGQFRIRISQSVNTDWFADYIIVGDRDGIRSEYYHIGWSVLFYPLENVLMNNKFQPYVLAGHCFDYNQKTLIADASISKSRWGGAVQGGLGTHFNITERFDLSLTCQYMIHLTKEIELEIPGEVVEEQHEHSALEGHLLSTLSFNYKLFKLWNR